MFASTKNNKAKKKKYFFHGGKYNLDAARIIFLVERQ
jgi:hypothetical protein